MRKEIYKSLTQFLGYSNISRAYRVFKKRTLVLEEFMHVVFDEYVTPLSPSDLVEENILEL